MSRGKKEKATVGIGGLGSFRGVFAVAALCLFVSGIVASSALAAAPSIPLTTASQVTTESATLEADINPGGKATLYRFEYGPADCASNPCTTVPVPEGKLAAGALPVRVGAPIEGLTPGTTYFFRAVAKNSEGETKGPSRTLTTLILPPVFDSCPNDLFRAGLTGSGPGLRLPDCRAYEQASPTDKNGTSLLGELTPLKTSLSGDAISFESSSGIPGGEGAQNFPFYLATRDGSDWSTQGLLPHGSAGDAATVTGWTRDFAWSYSTARRSGADEEGYFARSSKGGSLESIVDYTAGLPVGLRPAFAGASEDGSRVFFDDVAPILPAAAPDKSNLYVWDRESDELSLAGVLPEGTAPPGGSFAGPYDWLLGTNKETLGRGGPRRDYYVQDDHAISDDGSRAYFTAGNTGQLYLREDPTEPGASTVNVSKSQKNNGSGPEGRDAAGTRPAAFMGATPDGSEAFFTSSEKLTNDATTGPEPSTFPAIACAEKDKDPIDVGCLPTLAQGVEVNATHIYWTNPNAGTIERAELADPQNTIEVIVEGASNPQDLAVDSEFVYWTNAGDEKIGTGTIGRAKLNGDEANQEFIKAASNPMGIDVNATHVFWANAAKIEGAKGTIGRAKLDGSEAIQDFVKINFPVAVPKGLALNATHIYWTMNIFQSGIVVRANLDGSEQEPLFINETEMNGIALDATHVYWSDPAAETIGRAKLDLTDPEGEFIKDAGQPKGLADDTTDLYWSANQEVAENPGNDLYRFEADTKELTDLVVDDAPNGAEVRGVVGISGDGSRVYFAANGVLTNAPNPEGDTATPGDCKGAPLGGSGSCNLYLWEEGGARFVGRLETGSGDSTDAANWAATPTGISKSLTFQKTSRLSADGRFLLFRSKGQLTDYPSEGTPQFYRYDAVEEELLCLTCSPTGLQVSDEPTLGSVSAFLISAGPPAFLLTRNLSAAGNRFFFETTEALVAEDTNGLSGCPVFKAGQNNFPSCQDAYMWEAPGTGSCETATQNGGCLYLLSTGKDPAPSFFADADLSGEDAFLLTSSQGLVHQDQDQLFDVYDARVKGGLKAQNEAREICPGLDPCHGPVTPQPTQESSGTGQSLPGDPLPKRKKTCPKGKRKAKVKGKARCVPKRRPAKQRKRHNRANQTRRASR